MSVRHMAHIDTVTWDTHSAFILSGTVIHPGGMVIAVGASDHGHRQILFRDGPQCSQKLFLVGADMRCIVVILLLLERIGTNGSIFFYNVMVPHILIGMDRMRTKGIWIDCVPISHQQKTCLLFCASVRGKNRFVPWIHALCVRSISSHAASTSAPGFISFIMGCSLYDSETLTIRQTKYNEIIKKKRNPSPKQTFNVCTRNPPPITWFGKSGMILFQIFPAFEAFITASLQKKHWIKLLDRVSIDYETMGSDHTVHEIDDDTHTHTCKKNGWMCVCALQHLRSGKSCNGSFDDTYT